MMTLWVYVLFRTRRGRLVGLARLVGLFMLGRPGEVAPCRVSGASIVCFAGVGAAAAVGDLGLPMAGELRLRLLLPERGTRTRDDRTGESISVAPEFTMGMVLRHEGDDPRWRIFSEKPRFDRTMR